MRLSREVVMACVRANAPFSFILPLVVLGYFLKPAAYLLLLSMLLVLLWSLALAWYLLVSLFCRRPIMHLLIGLLSCGLSLIAADPVIYGAPRWVKANARSVGRELDGWKSEYGTYPGQDSLDPEFPAALRKVVNQSDCLVYQPKGNGYELTCRGVFLTKCTFDSQSQHWSSWD
jgi:hypothetical protein